MRFDSSARFALVAALAALLVAGVGFRAAVAQLNIYLRKESVPLREGLSTLPTRLGPWVQVGKDVQLSEAVVEELGTRQYLDRTYRHEETGVVMSVHVAYYTGMIDAIPHVPERCWGAGGLVQVEGARQVPLPLDQSAWTLSDAPPNRATGEPYRWVETVDPITRRLVREHAPIGDFALRAIEFQNDVRPRERLLGGYFFLANGRATSSAIGVRSLAFQPAERFAYYAKVQFAMPASAEDETRWQTFQDSATDLLQRLLPHLMRRLPDWSEVESASTSGATATPTTPSTTTSTTRSTGAIASD